MILGTGPSVTPDQLTAIRRSGLPVFGCNNAYQHCDLDVLLSCNVEWWDWYYPRDKTLRESRCDKWTWDAETARKYRLLHIAGKWAPSLSVDRSCIHYGHSSGYQLLGIAYHYGVREMVLIGYDLRYPAGYDKSARQAGGNRHWFGEYPEQLQHWPAVGPNGEMTGLLDCYRTIDCAALGLRIINATPGSALDFFEVDLDAI